MNKNESIELKNKQKQEALTRMEMLGLDEVVIRDFARTGRLYYSERTPYCGVLFWLDQAPEWMAMVQEFEENHDALVYHVTHEVTEFGDMLSLLYVSAHEDEWDMDYDDIDRIKVTHVAYPIAYVINLTDPDLSEFGSIGVQQKGGGLIRIA